MKINYVVWGVGNSVKGKFIDNVNSGVLIVNKFNVGSCMEGFFDDKDFKWKDNKSNFNWNGNKDSIVVEGIDGYERWVFSIVVEG